MGPRDEEPSNEAAGKKVSLEVMESLKRKEKAYRDRLEREPDDMEARASMAWCLFMQSLHQAGRESTFAALMAASRGKEQPRRQHIAIRLDRDARALLRDCLRQTITIDHLSPYARDRSDMAKLRALIRVSGGEQVVDEAQAEAARILADLMHDIMGETERTDLPH